MRRPLRTTRRSADCALPSRALALVVIEVGSLVAPSSAVAVVTPDPPAAITIPTDVVTMSGPRHFRFPSTMMMVVMGYFVPSGLVLMGGIINSLGVVGNG